MDRDGFCVVILKAASEETCEIDPYELAFKNCGISATIIPTLDFRWKNSDSLKELLRHPDQYAGMIISSPRCAKAVIQILEADNNKELLDQWQKLECFAVGDSTGRLLSNNLNLSCKGSDAGNLSQLMALIEKNPSEKPLLMPVGSLHKNQESIVKTTKIEVYETIEHPSLGNSLCGILKSTSIFLLMSFFSPSGVKFALPYIKQYPEKKLKFIAIGATTAQELKKSDLPVDGVCTKPTSENLVEEVEKIISHCNKCDSTSKVSVH